MTTAPQQPAVTQDGREHYLWQQQPISIQFAGTIWHADHPTIFEHATMTCLDEGRTVVTLQTLADTATLGFDTPGQARDAVEALWLTYPGYGHNPNGL